MEYYKICFRISAPIELITDARDLLMAVSGDAGLEAFDDGDTEPQELLIGYVQTTLFNRGILDDAIKEFPFESVTISYSIEKAENRDWNEEWEKNGFMPIVISEKCAIHDGRHYPDKDYPVTVEIVPKQAFGTGLHETTRMIISELLDMNLDGKYILDCGCGTGILGITALKCGAGHVFGYDIDEWSVKNTRYNSSVNSVADRYDAELGDASILSRTKDKFNIIMANINRNILLNDMSAFIKRLDRGGSILLSGFYAEDIPVLEAEIQKHNMSIKSIKEENGWAMIRIV